MTNFDTKNKMKEETLNRNENLCEYLSNDILEEDFVNMFSRYITVLKVLGASRVDVRDRFVSPPTRLQKYYSILFAGIGIASLVVPFFYSPEPCLRMNLLLFLASLLTLAYSAAVCVHARFLNNQGNVELYIKMQRIDRLMGLQRHTFLTQVLRNINSLFLCFTTVLYLFMLISASVGGVTTFSHFIRVFLFLFMCSLDISYCSNLIVFFYTRVCFIHSILLNHVKGKPIKRRIRLGFRLRKIISQLAAQSHDFRTCELDIYLSELLKCFYDFQDLHQLPIALYIIHFYSSIMINAQYIIYKVKENELTINVKFFAPIFVASSIIQLFSLCIRFELFYKEIKEVKRNVVAVMSYHFDGPLYEKAKRIWKLLEEVPPGFSVYGVWQIDAVFFIHFFNVSSAMLFTLLQFAFL